MSNDLTLEKAYEAIEQIKQSAWDYERAHSMEDGLWERFIELVAQRNDDLGELAKLVLTTKDIDFERYYA